MRSFGIISPRFWTGDTGRRLRDRGHQVQLVAVYLMTSPHSHMCGLYYLPLQFAAHEMGMSIKDIKKAIDVLQNEGFAYYDAGSEFVWVKEMSHWQVGPMKNGDRRDKGIHRWYTSLPPNPFLGLFFDRYGEELQLPVRREAPTKGELRGMEGAAAAPYNPSPVLSPVSVPSEEKPEKQKFGERGNVRLTQVEHEKLKAKLGEHCNDFIERLDAYPGVNPKRFRQYTDHYDVITTWFNSDVREGKIRIRAPDSGELESVKQVREIFRKKT